jgi:hypothetical protein
MDSARAFSLVDSSNKNCLKRLASERMHEPYNHSRRPSLDSIQVKHTGTEGKSLSIILLFVLCFDITRTRTL